MRPGMWPGPRLRPPRDELQHPNDVAIETFDERHLKAALEDVISSKSGRDGPRMRVWFFSDEPSADLCELEQKLFVVRYQKL